MSYLLDIFRSAGGLGGDPNGLGGANHPTGVAPPSVTAPTPGQFDPGYVGSFGWYRDEAQRKAAQEQFDAAGSLEERGNQLLTDLYYGGVAEEDRRVITPEELKTGWVDSNGMYHQGRETSFGNTGAGGDDQNIRYRNLSHDWYTSGMDLFDQPYEITNEWDLSDNAEVYGNPEWMRAAEAYLKAINGGKNTTSPWLDTFQQDRIGTYNFIRDSDYNAFLGSFGGKQSGVDGYRDDSIAGYFKNAFAGKDQIGNRRNAVNDLKNWNQANGLNRATDVMTKQYFDQMDLANKYGLTWEQAGAVVDSNGGGSNGINSGNGMLSHQDSSWQDVLNRGGASLDNWDSLLGQYTYDSPLNWANMSDQEVENSFGNLFDNGGMFTQGKNRDLIYATLMENLGRG